MLDGDPPGAGSRVGDGTWGYPFPAHYGYPPDRGAQDGDHLDAFLGETPSNPCLSDRPGSTLTRAGSTNKGKMLQFDSGGTRPSRPGGRAFTTDGAEPGIGLAPSPEMTVVQFRNWVRNGKTKQAFAY